MLEVLIKDTSLSNCLVLLGDFSARTGSKHNAWEGVLGSKGIGSMNENGQTLLELCTRHNLCIPSTFFTGSERAKVTWKPEFLVFSVFSGFIFTFMSNYC